MRIRYLDLQAFGPFTDKHLDLDKASLHIIYGPNEAGKSSALRGLKALLYGFPERTTDNFIHTNDKLLVGGCLQLSDGQELSFMRRKKRLANLLDADGNILAANALAPYLGGIAPDVFAALYGITHAELVRGGEEILAQKGEVGQALFAAGSGLSSLKEVLDNLQVEADELFKPKGSKPKINQLLAEYKKLRKKAREAALPSRQWHDHQRALTTAEDKLKALEEERRALEKQRHGLERLHRALPQLGRRQALLAELAGLGEVMILPADFSERRQTVEKEIHAVVRQQEMGRGRLRELEKNEKTVSSPSLILTQALAIEELYQGLDRYRKDRRDRDKLDGLRVGYRIEAVDLLRQIRQDISLQNIEQLRPFLNRRRAMQRLAGQAPAIAQGKKMAEQRLANLKKELEASKTAAATMPETEDMEALRLACRLAQRAGSIDEDLAERTQILTTLKKNSQRDLDRLGLWTGKIADIGKVHLPLPETIERFDRKFQALAERERLHRLASEKASEDIRTRETGRKTLQMGGQVPTEKDLQKVRLNRNEDWQKLRECLLKREKSTFDEPVMNDMTIIYEDKVLTADTLADRLRREADRVHTYALLQNEILSLRQSLADLAAQTDDLTTDRQTLEKEWQRQWRTSGISPLGTKEMLAWATGFDKLRFQIAEIENRSDELLRRSALRRRLISDLLAELERYNYTGAREELQAPLLFAEGILAEHDKLAGERHRLKIKIIELTTEVEQAVGNNHTASQELEKWQQEWQGMAGDWQNGTPPQPADVNDILETLRDCFDKIKEADTLEKRIKGIDRDLETFSQAVTKLATTAEAHLPCEQVVRGLMAALSEARENKALLDKCTKELAAAQKEMNQLDIRLHSLYELRAELLKIADCQPDEVLAAERRSTDLLQIKDKLESVQTSLIELAQGRTIAALEEEAKAVNPDDLPGMISAASRRIGQEIEPEIKRLSEAVWEGKKTLSLMDGRSKAAELGEIIQSRLAQIQRLAEQYIRIKTAAGILRQQIESYRAANQDPVLAIASKHFVTLSRGSFAGLKTDENNKGLPMLIGLRGDNDRLPVESMSSGTRDQLYLALRLASLQWRLRDGEPMPFIVDDILINFDDERSKATLEVLAELAKLTQVIVFTHHRQIVTNAQQLKNNNLIQIHTLVPRKP